MYLHLAVARDDDGVILIGETVGTECVVELVFLALSTELFKAE